jgi:hypothetical protein
MSKVQLTFAPEQLEVAIALVARESARTTGRNIEWIKRRLHEAIKFCDGKGSSEHPDWQAYFDLAGPVFCAAALIGGVIDTRDVSIH